MNNGFQLYQLQQIDSNIDSAQSRIEEIDQKINDNQTIKSAELVSEGSLKFFIEIKNSFENLNAEIQSKKNKKGQSESSLYGGTVKNPKELQDLQQEITSLTGIISKLEDELLEKLIDLEGAEEKMNFAKEALLSTRSDFATQKSLLTGEKQKLLKNIENQQVQRESLLEGIDKKLLGKYENLRISKKGRAVSTIDEDACSACGTSLTPSQKQKARSASEILYCSSCGRIVYGS